MLNLWRNDVYFELSIGGGVNNECINKLVMEYEDLENDFNNDYYTESSTDKIGLLNKMISKLKELCKSISSYVSKLIKSSTSKVKDLNGKVQVDKKVWNGIKKFLEIAEKFLTAPLNFIKKHKKGSAVIAILTGLTLSGLVIGKKMDKKREDDMKHELGYSLSQAEVRTKLQRIDKLTSKANGLVSDFENELNNTKKILEMDTQIRNNFRNELLKADDKLSELEYNDQYIIKPDDDKARQENEKLINKASEKYINASSQLNIVDKAIKDTKNEISYLKNRVDWAKEKKPKYRKMLNKKRTELNKWDIDSLSYCMNLLKQVLVNLKKTATTLSKA